ncbi:hypothetical protein [Arthrobacter sp. W4I7]|uniref:hypothetical protein n=1 Tax=Arthrobacter sp. W4I7 TaxID=3042296 RepID=UPI00277DEC11|nr:hypothetical protein [Arthrobacter sp. W4I7]MDQ0692555.1 hypothetical protein [Arthrobacter sp. W4I7]
MIRNPFKNPRQTFPGRPLWWPAGAAVAALVVVLTLVLSGNAGKGPAATTPQTLTSLVFPPSGTKDVGLAAAGVPVNVKNGTVTPLAGIR